LSFIIYQAQAQKPAENQLGTWYMYNGSHKLSEKYALKTMAHFRYFELASEFQQEIYRLGINYTFTKKINLTLGASYSTGDLAYNVPSAHLYEWRLYEDLNVKSKWGKFNAKHRFRLEHRFIHKNIITDETRNWFRYDLTVNYPISIKWSVYAFNELFLNIDRSKRFAQNWTGAGFLHQLNEQVKLKIGYFQIKLPNSVLKRIQLGVILNTDFSHKLI
jgi:long-subunit fatty acid transport protein